MQDVVLASINEQVATASNAIDDAADFMARAANLLRLSRSEAGDGLVCLDAFDVQSFLSHFAAAAIRLSQAQETLVSIVQVAVV